MPIAAVRECRVYRIERQMPVRIIHVQTATPHPRIASALGHYYLCRLQSAKSRTHF